MRSGGVAKLSHEVLRSPHLGMPVEGIVLVRPALLYHSFAPYSEVLYSYSVLIALLFVYCRGLVRAHQV